MNFTAAKSFLGKNRGLLLVIITISALSLLCLLSYIFWDQPFFQWQRQNLNDLEKPIVFKALEQLGKTWLLIWLLLCWALLSKCHPKVLIPMIAMIMLIFTILPMKFISHRQRPRDIIKNHEHPDRLKSFSYSSSFPSGDTASTFAVIAAIVPFMRWPSKTVLLILACCVGLLRILTFSHYLSDVFAGAMLGISVAYLAYRWALAKPQLINNLAKLLNPKIVLAMIVVIPLMLGIFKGLDDLLIFSVFYPPLVLLIKPTV